MLKDSLKYKNVFIENDMTREKRLADFNNRTILRALGKDKEYRTVAGRITRKQSNNVDTEPENSQSGDHSKTYNGNYNRGWGRGRYNRGRRY